MTGAETGAEMRALSQAPLDLVVLEVGLGGRFVLPLAETAPRVALATDIEYALNSQNGSRPLLKLESGFL